MKPIHSYLDLSMVVENEMRCEKETKTIYSFRLQISAY